MNFLKGKAVGWYISLAAMIAAIVSVIVYAVRGGDSTNLSPVDSTAVTMFAIGIVCNAIVLIKDFGIGGFVPFVFYTIVVGVLLLSSRAFLKEMNRYSAAPAAQGKPANGTKETSKDLSEGTESPLPENPEKK